MQTVEINRSAKGDQNILILADYTQGNQAAIYFAMRYLYRPGSQVYLVQTWDKPSFGSSMIRDLSPTLNRIVNSELRCLRTHLQRSYSMPEDQISLIAHEGDLASFFKTELYTSSDWQVVMAIGNDERGLGGNGQMIDLVERVSQDLYILQDINEDYAITELFVFADSCETTPFSLSVLKKMVVNETPSIHICLSQTFNSSNEREKRLLPLIEHCEGSKLDIFQLKKNEAQDEIKAFSKKTGGKLFLFEKNSKRQIRNRLRVYLNSWLLKSKGIRI